MLGAVDHGYLFDLLEALARCNGPALMEIADNMAMRSISFEAALQELATLLHRIALAQVVPQALSEDEPERDRLLAVAQSFSDEDVQLYYQIAIHGRDEMSLAPDEYAGFTMTMMRMLAFAPGKASISPSSGRRSLAQDHEGPSTLRPEAVKSDGSEDSVGRSRAASADANAAQVASGGEKPVEIASSPTARPDWAVLIGKLNSQGMAQQLAKNCTLESLSDREVVLRLSQEHRHLQGNKIAAEKLQAYLSDYFAKPMKLKITLGESTDATPAVMEQRTREFRQQQASEAIAHDGFVREAQEQLDATLIEESIKGTN
jgi:DNA polymerase-3 subunit gamma/tau